MKQLIKKISNAEKQIMEGEFTKANSSISDEEIDKLLLK